MKYWENISTQEQRTIKRGLIIIGLLIVLRFMWWPLYSSVENLKEDIANEADLVAWMKPTVESLKNTKEPLASVDNTTPRLSVIEKSFAQAGLSVFVKSLSQNENQQIVLEAQSVPFGALASCLETMAKNNGIAPVSLTATREKTGVVDVQIIF